MENGITREDVEFMRSRIVGADVRPYGCQHERVEDSVGEHGWICVSCLDCGRNVMTIHPASHAALMKERSGGLS